jgi:hypothetical protein
MEVLKFDNELKAHISDPIKMGRVQFLAEYHGAIQYRLDIKVKFTMDFYA